MTKGSCGLVMLWAIFRRTIHTHVSAAAPIYRLATPGEANKCECVSPFSSTPHSYKCIESNSLFK
jgi:hypothetical protein